VSETTVWLCNAAGERLFPFAGEFVSLNYTKVVNGTGKLHRFSAAADDFDPSLVGLDYQLQAWRTPEGGTTAPDFVALLRHWKFVLDEGGGVYLLVEDNKDQNEILERRIVAYKSGTAEAVAGEEAADDLMKRLFDENFLAGATDAARHIQGNRVTVDADVTAGPELDKGFAFQTVLELFQEISQEARQAGAEVFFELAITEVDYATGYLSLQFRTYTGQPGADRTHDTDNPVIFSPQFANVDQMELVYDYRGEENAVYVGGPGEGEARTVEEVEDTDAQAASPWGRREGFVDARDAENTAAALGVDVTVLLQARGQQRLGETRPKVRLNGRVRSTDFTLYGRDWFLGDRVTVNGLGVQFDALIRAVNVDIQPSGERITALVEAEL
jgi:hypothetical protein